MPYIECVMHATHIMCHACHTCDVSCMPQIRCVIHANTMCHASHTYNVSCMAFIQCVMHKIIYNVSCMPYIKCVMQAIHKMCRACHSYNVSCIPYIQCVIHAISKMCHACLNVSLRSSSSLSLCVPYRKSAMAKFKSFSSVASSTLDKLPQITGTLVAFIIYTRLWDIHETLNRLRCAGFECWKMNWEGQQHSRNQGVGGHNGINRETVGQTPPRKFEPMGIRTQPKVATFSGYCILPLFYPFFTIFILFFF